MIPKIEKDPSIKTPSVATHLNSMDLDRALLCMQVCEGIPSEKLIGKTLAEYVTNEAYIAGFTSANHENSMSIGFNGLGCQLLVNSFAGQFVGAGAINYLVVDMEHDEIDSFTVTIQRSGKTTPADKLNELKSEIDRLTKENQQLSSKLNKINLK